jgi:hypothetical protein
MILTVVEYPQQKVHKLSWDVIPSVGHFILLRTGLPTGTGPCEKQAYEVLAVVWDGGSAPYVVVGFVSSPYAALIASMG